MDSADKTTVSPTKSQPSGRLITIPFIVLVVITFFNGLIAKGMNSGLPYYYDSLGYSAALGGTFVAVYTIASTVTRLFAGQITDTFDHIRVLLIGLGLLFVGTAIPIVFDQLYVVMACRILQGAGFSIATNVITVTVMEISPKGKLGESISYKGVGSSTALMFGAVIATWLLDHANYRLFFAFFAGLMLIALIATLLLTRNKIIIAARQGRAAVRKAQREAKREITASSSASHTSSDKADTLAAQTQQVNGAKTPAAQADLQKAKRGLREYLHSFFIPSALPFMLVEFVRRIPKGLAAAFMLIFAKHAGLAAGATFFLVAGFAELVCRILGGKVFDHANSWLLLPMVAIGVLGFGSLWFWPSEVTLCIAGISYGITIGTSSPFLKTLTAKSVPHEHWGVANSELYFFGDLGLALGAWVGGILVDALGKGSIPAIITIVTAVATLLVAAVLAWSSHTTKTAKAPSAKMK